MKIKMSVDDGCASDVMVADLAKKYGVDTTFYWPVEWHSLAYEKGYKPLSWLTARSIAKEHNIGSHTITHRHLTGISWEDAEYEIEASKYILQDMLGVAITDFAPPRGYTNDILTDFTLQFYKRQRLTKGKGLLHIHPNSGANNNMPWREYAKTIEVEEIWGHSWEFDKYHLWNELEDYLKEQNEGR